MWLVEKERSSGSIENFSITDTYLVDYTII